jgi:lysine 2,3-aminomutase
MIDQKHTTATLQVSDLLPQSKTDEHLQALAQVEVPDPIKDPVPQEEITHRKFDGGTFWHKVPAFGEVDEEEFLDWKFQNKHTVRNVDQLEATVRDLVDPEFLEDVREGLHLAPMNMRLSPYILSRIDWSEPYDDPVRRQFIPVASTKLPDHPRLALDSLHERKDSPVRGLVHRYPDKALFLPIDVCPVY